MNDVGDLLADRSPTERRMNTKVIVVISRVILAKYGKGVVIKKGLSSTE